MARALHLINKIYCLFNENIYIKFSNKSREITMGDNGDAKFMPKAIDHFECVSYAVINTSTSANHSKYQRNELDCFNFKSIIEDRENFVEYNRFFYLIF